MTIDTQTNQVEKLSWTEDRVEQLKKLWSDGLSASQIAVQLAGGVTRNAVIGKVHRLGLSGRVTTSRSSSPRPRRPRQPSHPGRGGLPTAGNTALKPQTYNKPAPAPEPEPVPIRLVDQPSGGDRVTVLSLSDKTCRWPIGDPGSEEFCFCGHSPKDGTPYCDYHARVAYQPMQERRSRRASGGR